MDEVASEGEDQSRDFALAFREVVDRIVTVRDFGRPDDVQVDGRFCDLPPPLTPLVLAAFDPEELDVLVLEDRLNVLVEGLDSGLLNGVDALTEPGESA